MTEYQAIIDGTAVSVDKAGGGTVGRTYEGWWVVSVEGLLDAVDLRTGMPKTHAQVARLALSFVRDDEL